MNLNTTKKTLLVALLLFILTVAIRIPVLRSVGETWDEFAVVYYGETYISALKNLDFSESSWIQNYEHPPLAKYLYGLSRSVARKIPAVLAWDSEYHPDKEYTLPRILSAIFGGLTAALVFLIGKMLFNSRVGFVSSLILAITPHFIAYTSIASLESPFIFFTTLFIYFLIKALRSNSGLDHLLSVIALTLSFTTRYNGAFFVIFYGVVMLIRYRKDIFSFRFRNITIIFFLSPIIFLGLFYALWPWLWLTPQNIFDSLLRSSGGHTGEYFFASLGQPGWYYYFVYFLATTPEVLILALVFFIVLFGRKLRKKELVVREEDGSGKAVPSFFQPPLSNFLLLLGWFLIPFLASFSQFKQDGIRYVISFTPALAVIAGWVIVTVSTELISRVAKLGFSLCLLVALLYPVVFYFPYYLDYYNIIWGGPAWAYENNAFEVGWWGEGGLSAVRFLNQNADKNAIVRTDFAPSHALITFRSDIRTEKNYVVGNKDDFILVNTYNERYGDPNMLSDLSKYHLVYEVTTSVIKDLSAPLVKVYKRNENSNIN